jgi:hypothetical protein
VQQRFELVAERANAIGTGEHLVEHRPGTRLVELLGEIADAQVLRAMDVARVGVLQTHDDLHQRGLAHPVSADERDAPTRQQPEGDVTEQRSLPVRFGETGDRDHSPVRLMGVPDARSRPANRLEPARPLDVRPPTGRTIRRSRPPV